MTSQSSYYPNSPLKILTSLANNQKIIEIDWVDLLLHGMATSTYCNELSVSQRAMHGILTYEASTTACRSDFGSATITNLGSWNFLVF